MTEKKSFILLETPKGMSHGERKHTFSARYVQNKNNITLNLKTTYRKEIFTIKCCLSEG